MREEEADNCYESYVSGFHASMHLWNLHNKKQYEQLAVQTEIMNKLLIDF